MKNQIFIEFELLAQKQVIGFERSLMKVLQTRDSDRIDEIWEKEIYDDRYYNRMCVCVFELPWLLPVSFKFHHLRAQSASNVYRFAKMRIFIDSCSSLSL